MKVRNWIVGIIILLAAGGLISSLFNQPTALFKQILWMVFTVAAIYFIYRLWSRKKPGNRESRSFAMAARKSKKRVKTRQAATTTSLYSKKAFRKKSAAHLTVIEGKKGKKRDRAIF